MRRCTDCRTALPASVPDHQSYRCTTRYAFPAAGCNRADHHLYRTEPYTFCDLQCIHQLAIGSDRTCHCYYFQYLGQRYVQDHPDPHGNHRILCGSTDHERCRNDMRRWERHLKLQRCG